MDAKFRVDSIYRDPETSDIWANCYDLVYGDTFDKYIGQQDDTMSRVEAAAIIQDSNYEMTDDIRNELHRMFNLDDVDPEMDDEFDWEDPTEPVEDDEPMESLNIRESLNRIDINTDNKYDLLNLYESCTMTNEDKKELATLIYDKEDPSVIYDTLNGKFLEGKYGGAFDMEDDLLFTRDDLNEFGEDVADAVSANSQSRANYVSSYIENGELEITLEMQDYEETVTLKIDMRKFRNHFNLYRAYGTQVVNMFIEKFTNDGITFDIPLSGQDYPYNESLSNDHSVNKKFDVTFKSYTGDKTITVNANDKDDAVDKAIQKVYADNDEDIIIDYYDLYDMCEGGETVDEFAERNGLIGDGDYFAVVDVVEVDSNNESLKEDYSEYIYLFPELTDEDIDFLKAYNLKYLGKNYGAYGDEENWVVQGDKDNLERYAQNYLGYELHPDYLYDADEFAGDIVNESLKEDYYSDMDENEILDFKRNIESATDVDEIEDLISSLSDGVLEDVLMTSLYRKTKETDDIEEIKSDVLASLDIELDESLKEGYNNITKELSSIYNNALETLLSGANLDVKDNISKAFSDIGGTVSVRARTNSYIEYSGKLGDYRIAGSVSMNNLKGDLNRLAEDLTMAYYRVKLGGELYNTSTLLKMIRNNEDVELHESLNEDTLNNVTKKDIKKQYKNLMNKYGNDVDKYNRNKEFIDDFVSKHSDELKDNEKDLLYKFQVGDKPTRPNKDDISIRKELETNNYPFYVTYYTEYPAYEPAEGGYYVATAEATHSKGFDTKEEANDYAQELADENGLEKVGSYWIKKSKYIGEDEFIYIENNKSYLSKEKGYDGYESLKESAKDVPNWFKSLCQEAKDKFGKDVYSIRDYLAEHSDIDRDTIREWYIDVRNELGLPVVWDYDEWDKTECYKEDVDRKCPECGKELDKYGYCYNPKCNRDTTKLQKDESVIKDWDSTDSLKDDMADKRVGYRLIVFEYVNTSGKDVGTFDNKQEAMDIADNDYPDAKLAVIRKEKSRGRFSIPVTKRENGSWTSLGKK